ncbi:MAG: FAD-binding protein [Treponema sp.]|nr:FAD-binding protein [Treponema sp.]
MKIIVPIKQVPESSNVKMDPETGTLIRTGVETVVNPLDLYALEAALRLKEQHGGTITVISMGPPQAMKALKEAIAMGCDEGALISDRKFGGSDTHATSYTLSHAICGMGGYDLIITGERATDGDTAQVGPGIAAWLGIPLATYVSRIEALEKGRLHLERLVEEGYQVLSVPLPCLLTVVKAVAAPRLPTLKGMIRSRNLQIPVLNAETLRLDPEYLGLAGSPTRVVTIDTPKITRKGRILNVQDDMSLKAAVDAMAALLEKKGVLPVPQNGTQDGLPPGGAKKDPAEETRAPSFAVTLRHPARQDAREVWTLAEQFEGKLKGVSFEVLTRGRKLADTLGTHLVSVLIGDGVPEEDLMALIRRGADAVYAVQGPGLKNFVCEPYEFVLTRLIREYKPAILLAAATSTGRTLMPYAAIKNRTGLTADCTELDIEEGTGNLLQTRPAIGGNIMATIKTPHHRPQMATVRPKSSRPLSEDPTRTGEIRLIPVPPLPSSGTLVRGYRRDEAGDMGLEEADLVIAGGRGLKKSENFTLIRDLAHSLGAAVGASRDAVDRGWISYPHQVGLSGKTISPKVYIGIGISGAIQHLAGIKTSETIVSINSDPDAALHKIADLAIVGDAFQVIPGLRKRLNAR